MITLHNLSLPTSPALIQGGLQSLSLQLQRGEALWVVGPAESGKTALLDALALRRPVAGSATILNEPLSPHFPARTRQRLRQRIGYIDANPLFMDRLSLADNIALPLELAHFRHAEIQRETEAILQWFGLQDHAQALPTTLSHTTRLRAACARALITHPSLILVDEPALTLCPELQEHLLSTIKDLVQNGATALFAMRTRPPEVSFPEATLTLPYNPPAPTEDEKEETPPSLFAPLTPMAPTYEGRFS
ncbi:ATP-binding cassette domain-containing protein [Bombella pollinis]|uniref:ATP-binding cassette domain-containing protein n=1 Tax=Bombella pollinis TaxID=2967337 RepID=A0ABT3WRH5_9PROT|nr:ATP-binding cassette domain-containing protein [Bombella pollinis]MCX5620263.1 ATP-binding cassette domain-containing protein [Bombella pollinis]